MSLGDTAQVIIVTVHGTNDRPRPEGPKKWFEDGSEFARRLREQLSQRGIEVNIVPQIWSGANSARSRELGAEALARTVRRLHRAGKRVHLIGHSHGGNVAVDAACSLDWKGLAPKTKMISITTVGAPFLCSKLNKLAQFTGLAFFSIVALSALALPIAAVFLYQRSAVNPASASALVVAAIGMFAFFFALPMAWSGARRIRRISRKRNDNASVHSIWHANDEAINFLQRVEKVELEPFPPWSMWRGSQTAAISWAVSVTLLFWLITSILWIILAARQQIGLAFWLPLLLPICFVPIVFGVVYALARGVVGLLPELGLRKWANRTVSGILIGMSLGRDDDQRVGDVATTTPYFNATPVVLDGEVKNRMQEAAQAAASKLVEEYRWSLFSPEANTTTILNRLASDVMTWKSLIHTTYFDEPEMADIIATYIAGREREYLSH